MASGIVKQSFVSLVIGVAVLLCHNEFGSALHIETTPKHFDSLAAIHKELNITCLAQGQSYVGKKVLTMQLGKEGQRPFAVYNRQGIMDTTGLETNMMAKGYIDKNTGDNFLRLSITNPVLGDTGTYGCSVFYLNELFEIKEDAVSANVTVENNKILTMFASLESKISTLEKTVQKQGDVISQQKQTLQGQADQLKAQDKKDGDTESIFESLVSRLSPLEKIVQEQGQTISDQKHTIKALAVQLKEQDKKVSSKIGDIVKKQQENAASVQKLPVSVVSRMNNLEVLGKENSKQISKLVDKAAFQSAFSAGYDKKDTFKDGDILRFSESILNVGNDYNSGTGKYTAPRKGLYAFSLFVTILEKQFIHINLKSKGRVVASLYAYDDKYSDQSSVSTVVSLGAGDQVWPEVAFIGGKDGGKTGVYPDDHYSLFSGVLLK